MNKKFTLLTISLVAVVTMGSCKKEKGDDGPITGFTITASNIQGIPSGTQIDEVWLSVYNFKDEKMDIVAKSPFKNNGFSITFPASMDNKYLIVADDWWIPEVDPSIKITPPEDPYFIAAYKGVGVGYFALKDVSSWVGYMFSTAPFTLTGSANGGYFLYSMNVESGWNQYAIISNSDTETYTTTIPSGLVWWFGTSD